MLAGLALVPVVLLINPVEFQEFVIVV